MHRDRNGGLGPELRRLLLTVLGLVSSLVIAALGLDLSWPSLHESSPTIGTIMFSRPQSIRSLFSVLWLLKAANRESSCEDKWAFSFPLSRKLYGRLQMGANRQVKSGVVCWWSSGRCGRIALGLLLSYGLCSYHWILNLWSLIRVNFNVHSVGTKTSVHAQKYYTWRKRFQTFGAHNF